MLLHLCCYWKNCMYRDFSCSNASSKMYLELNIIVNHSVPFTSDGIATRYGLNGPGIESRWGARFSAPVHTGPGAHNGYRLYFQVVKRPGRDIGHPLPFGAEVKESVELYLYPPSGPSLTCCSVYFTYTLLFHKCELSFGCTIVLYIQLIHGLWIM
jgi:hypothetical protein